MPKYKVTASFTTARRLDTTTDEDAIQRRLTVDGAEVKRASGGMGYTITRTVDAADPESAADKVADYAGAAIGLLDRVLVEDGEDGGSQPEAVTDVNAGDKPDADAGDKPEPAAKRR